MTFENETILKEFQAPRWRIFRVNKVERQQKSYIKLMEKIVIHFFGWRHQNFSSSSLHVIMLSARRLKRKKNEKCFTFVCISHFSWQTWSRLKNSDSSSTFNSLILLRVFHEILFYRHRRRLSFPCSCFTWTLFRTTSASFNYSSSSFQFLSSFQLVLHLMSIISRKFFASDMLSDVDFR